MVYDISIELLQSFISNISRLEAKLYAESAGGVSPDQHDSAWAAAGHPHSVYPTSFAELLRVTDASPMVVNTE